MSSPYPLPPFPTKCQLWMFCKASILKFPHHTLYINMGQLTIDRVYPWPDDTGLWHPALHFSKVKRSAHLYVRQRMNKCMNLDSPYA